MRNYHIRISLKGPSPPAPTASTSYSPTSPSLIPPPTIPESLLGTLPSHSPRFATRRHTVGVHDQGQDTASRKPRDYRFGPIRIDWIDRAPETMSKGALRKTGVGKEKETDRQRRGEPVTAAFLPHASTSDKSGSTTLPEGIVHIYRDTPRNTETSQAASVSLPPLDNPPRVQASSSAEKACSSVDSEPVANGLVLAVLAVPSWMTPSDFLGFVAPASEGIALLRMIRDSAPNRSLVVLKFREASDAVDFAEEYNGKPFNSMEPEICHVVRVSSIMIDSDDPSSQTITRPGLADESGTIYELPTCPVCLERMDAAVTGLVTVPCSHTFHCACLSKWGDSRCPVCRYSQTLLSSHPPSSTGPRSPHPIPFSLSSTASQCMDCGSAGNLWICLICGNVGCGRYGRAHAHAHYTHTTHLYALELETQRVWDYAGDGYVHRLIQNKADGKLVELPSAAIGINGTRGEGGESTGPSAADALSAEKIEAIGIEYSYLLTSQLDSQRAFYEEQTIELRHQISYLRDAVERLSAEVEKGKTIATETKTQVMAHENARGDKLEAELTNVQRKLQRTTTLAQSLTKDLQEERAVSKGLMENLHKAKEQIESAERAKVQSSTRIAELEDQLRDVMFFLETRTKVEDGEGLMAEAAGGSIVTANPSNVSKAKTKTRKQRR